MSRRRRRPPGRLPLRKSLLGRLLLVSALVAVCSVAATAWIAVQSTSGALKTQQSRLLADDVRILDTLTGYAATHTTWAKVAPTARRLADETGRRIVLTGQDGHPITDTDPRSGPPSSRAATVVDPLRTNTATSSPIDPRAVGPYRLPRPETTKLTQYARQRASCLADSGIDASVVTTPSGRPALRTTADPGDNRFRTCFYEQLLTPTATERSALDALNTLVSACLTDPLTGIRVNPDFTWRGTVPLPAGNDALITTCVTKARQQQLAPFTAPPARLIIAVPQQDAAQGFTLSPANTARIAGAATLVLALTVGASVLAAARLVRPLRTLTHAAQQMCDADPASAPVNVTIRTDDEIGKLATAFNDMAQHRARLEEQRRAMVGDVAHELRTPLSNIRGWLEAAQDGMAAPDQEFVASLHEEAVLLQHVIDDLQDLAAADAGQLQLRPEPVEIGELLAQVEAAHRARAETAGVRITTDLSRGDWITGDPVRLRQAVGNLVSNAIRHTPPGGSVTLTYQRGNGWTAINVADTGCGIAPEDQPRVFDRFWRVDRSRSRQTGGSGLGLPIARKLAEAHRGTITVHSAPERGTLFTLRLPDEDTPSGLRNR
ncbi:sensor histidine kinase [Streptomyces sp. NPDC055709]